MVGKYKLTEEDKKFVLGDKRIKSVKQRKDGVIEIETNNITMYSHYVRRRAYNDDSNRSTLPQADLGEVKIEIDVDAKWEGFPPFRLTNPKPKVTDRYGSKIHHPMYSYNPNAIHTYGCLGHFETPFRRAFINKDLVEIVAIILASMEHVYNHHSSLWEWRIPSG